MRKKRKIKKNNVKYEINQYVSSALKYVPNCRWKQGQLIRNLGNWEPGTFGETCVQDLQREEITGEKETP